MPVRIVSAGGGGVTLSAASTGSEFTATLPANTGTVVTTASSAVVTPAMLTQPLTLATAQASTSGTAIDFTGIPSWVRRVTVMFNGVSTTGTSSYIVQLGTSVGFATSGYTGSLLTFGPAFTSFSTGFLFSATVAARTMAGQMFITNISGNSWVETSSVARQDSGDNAMSGGAVTLAGVLDRVRITTVGGTDTFDAGSINILYEG